MTIEVLVSGQPWRKGCGNGAEGYLTLEQTKHMTDMIKQEHMQKYYFFDGNPGWTGFKIVEFDDYHLMIEAVRKFHIDHGFLPVVFYGKRLNFEPAEIVKSWKIESTAV